MFWRSGWPRKQHVVLRGGQKLLDVAVEAMLSEGGLAHGAQQLTEAQEGSFETTDGVWHGGMGEKRAANAGGWGKGKGGT